jgi:glycogen operon protein
LYDLVAYNQKHNEANGHWNTDGNDDNRSWNCGWEGHAGAPPEIVALRRRQVRNFFALLMLSNGTPMFCAGEEFLSTHEGNNNPYNQDNELNYIDWDLLRTNRDVFRFFQGMIAFRKGHPSIARSQFWREDVTWYGGRGREVDFSPGGQTLSYCLRGARLHDDDIYVMINSSANEVKFEIQEGSGSDWMLVADTNLPGPLDYVAPEDRKPLGSNSYPTGSRSVVVLCRPRKRLRKQAARGASLPPPAGRA